MLQTDTDDFIKDIDTIIPLSACGSFMSQGLCFLKYLVTPEDTSAGAGLNQQTVDTAIHCTARSTVKFIFWCIVSIVFSLLLGQL